MVVETSIVSRWNFILPLFPHKGNHTAKISPKMVHPFQYLLSVFPSAPFLYSVCSVMYSLTSSSGIFMFHPLRDRSFVIGGGGGARVGFVWGPCQLIRLQRAGLAKKY